MEKISKGVRSPPTTFNYVGAWSAGGEGAKAKENLFFGRVEGAKEKKKHLAARISGGAKLFFW